MNILLSLRLPLTRLVVVYLSFVWRL